MSTEEQKERVRSKLFPAETVEFNDVLIEVRPLRHGLVCEAIDFFWGAFGRFAEGTVDREFLMETAERLNRYLNQCVTVPDDPDLKIEDLPGTVIPLVVKQFLLLTLAPGNWKTLAQELQEQFGVTLSQGTQ